MKYKMHGITKDIRISKYKDMEYLMEFNVMPR